MTANGCESGESSQGNIFELTQVQYARVAGPDTLKKERQSV